MKDIKSKAIQEQLEAENEDQTFRLTKQTIAEDYDKANEPEKVVESLYKHQLISAQEATVSVNWIVGSQLVIEENNLGSAYK